MNDHSARQPQLSRTSSLDNALRRARNVAEQRSHRYVTLEHLLLALLDDNDVSLNSFKPVAFEGAPSVDVFQFLVGRYAYVVHG